MTRMMKVTIYSMLGLTCLYVGNIDKRVDSNQLTDIFRKYGDL